MPKFETRRRVPHTARQMYDLVADVERYPQFLPLCTALRVRSRTPRIEGGEDLIAAMEVGYGAIRERFTSRVALDPGHLRIQSSYVDGPFRHMDNRWSFIEAPDRPEACDVVFYIDYEFKSVILKVLMGNMFDVAFRRFTDAFEKRAKAVYSIS